jgi:hypothetical protein
MGHGKIIVATGKPNHHGKYLAKPDGYVPDMRAYLRGNKDHIYGSYLSRPDGTAYVLAFDFDTKEFPLHKRHEKLLRQLAQGGAAPVYWIRQHGRGHLELYFDTPVDADAAREWCVAVCPALSLVEEVYPAAAKRNSPISWPLYQRQGAIVYPCIAKAILPEALDTVLVVSPKREVKRLIHLVRKAVTPASLIPPLLAKESIRTIKQLAPQERARAKNDTDIASMVIADFNSNVTWEEIIALCGGATRNGKFLAVWRGERTPSVKVDPDGIYACDYGRTGSYPKKLDKYEAWCLICGNGSREYKKTDLAERCRQYRQAHD